MSQLASFRKGWQSENLALYFLYQLAFVARPINIADDNGIDYYCTLFDVIDKKHLHPKSAFAFQVKSSSADINLTGIERVNLFNDLEMPFFVGVVNKSKRFMDVYSGEFLQLIAPWIGNPLHTHNPNYTGVGSKVLFRMVQQQPAGNHFYVREGLNHVVLFPHIGRVSIAKEASDIATMAEKLKERCALILRNIASRKAQSYVLDLYGTEEKMIFAGKDSAQSFRRNFHHRLVEVFHNLLWIYDRQRPAFRLDEFRRFERILAIFDPNGTMPIPAYEELKQKIVATVDSH